MKPKTAIFLVVVLLATVAVIVSRNEDLFPPDRAGDAEVNKGIWPVAIQQVTRCTIASADGRSVSLARSNDTWRITEPLDAAGDAIRIDRLVSTVKPMEFERAFRPGEPDAPTPKLTGLDSPRWTLTLTDDREESHVLNIGQTVPLSGQRRYYVQRAGDERVYVVEADFADMLDKPAGFFRDKTVLDVSADQIVRVRLTGREKIDLALREGLWRITSPVSCVADGDKVSSLVSKLAGLEAKEFVDDDPDYLRAYGLTPGSERLVARIWVKPDERAGEPATQPSEPLESFALALGNTADENRYAKLLDGPEVFLVRADLLDDLQVTLAGLRDKQVFPISADAVLAVDLQLPAGVAQFERQGGKWMMTNPVHHAANAEAVTELLEKIDALQAESFPDVGDSPELFGLAPARATVAIHQAGRRDKQILRIGVASPSGEVTFVQGADGLVAAVRSTFVEALLADPAGYFNTSILELPERSELTALGVSRPDGSFVLARQDGQWRMTEPIQAAVDGDAVVNITSKLSDLRAEKIVAVGDVPDIYTSGSTIEVDCNVTVQPAHAVTAATAPADQPAPETRLYRLRVAKVGGKSYAWRPYAEPIAVGQFGPDLYDALTLELRDKNIWTFDPAEIDNIRLTAGEDTLELQRSDAGWVCANDPYVKISSAKAEGFLKDVRDIKADRYAFHRQASQAELRQSGLGTPWYVLKLATGEGDSWQITVAGIGPNEDMNRFAVASTSQGVMVISMNAAVRMAPKLSDFRQ